MILFDDVVEVFHLTDDEVGAVFLGVTLWAGAQSYLFQRSLVLLLPCQSVK